MKTLSIAILLTVGAHAAAGPVSDQAVKDFQFVAKMRPNDVEGMCSALVAVIHAFEYEHDEAAYKKWTAVYNQPRIGHTCDMLLHINGW